jgi:hypothetical protein
MDEEKRKVVLLTAVIVLVIGLAVAAYFLFFAGGPRPVPEKKPAETAAAKPEGVGSDNVPVFPPTSLDASDDLIRKLAKELSTSPRLDAWLKSKDFVRKFTAAVDNIAAGVSPAKQIDFFAPEGQFQVFKIGAAEYIDPASYERYNLPTEVFVSFDPKETIRFFKGLKPLFQDAYKELGYPNKDFGQTLKKAILELLEAPVVEGDVRLEKKIKSYAYSDPKLESLTDAQKSFLRMGPANVGAIQIKLKEMALAMGVPVEQLPAPRVYREK